jgi:hypothetical protein
MPKKIKGLYVCEPAADGKHGDTFDSGKLASYALMKNSGVRFAKPTAMGVAPVMAGV